MVLWFIKIPAFKLTPFLSVFQDLNIFIVGLMYLSGSEREHAQNVGVLQQKSLDEWISNGLLEDDQGNYDGRHHRSWQFLNSLSFNK